MPAEGRDLILAGAILSIFANPFVFTAIAGRVEAAKKAAEAEAEVVERERELERREHDILIGFGRVGRLLAQRASELGRALVIVEEQADLALQASERGFTVVRGSGNDPQVLREAGIEQASKLIIAIPEGFEGGAIAERARTMNTTLTVFARAHSDEEVEHLNKIGVDHVVMGEREIANRLITLIAAAGGADGSRGEA